MFTSFVKRWLGVSSLLETIQVSFSKYALACIASVVGSQPRKCGQQLLVLILVCTHCNITGM